ncbi:FH1/FH2 domain-containing protein 3 [Elysia marginata]|uniref:FH1/FH2 domain-containing protein 3 n=1 Tax=Elysia marginata TaxID=1093978 RepID=A0AAV4FWR5_9GAST|nr:FH1/FH2 domain-containing protein 3 [Elysia marginata]
MATFSCRVQFLDDRDPFANTNFPEPTRPPNYPFLDNVPLISQIAGIHRLLEAPHRLEDCALQIYRYHSGAQADFGTYLDLESTLDEQADELEGFKDQ